MGDVATQSASRSEEEAMMRRKYPGAAAGRSALLEKRLSAAGPRKYFDSGDYNLAKEAAADPKHKNKLDLGFPLAVHSSSSSISPLYPKKFSSPLSPMFKPVNPMTPPSTPIDANFGESSTAAAAAGAALAAAAIGFKDGCDSVPQRKVRPPSALDLHQRRLSRQPSRLASEDDDEFEAAIKQLQQQHQKQQQQQQDHEDRHQD